MPFDPGSARASRLSRLRFEVMIADWTMRACALGSALFILLLTGALSQAPAQTAPGNAGAATGPCAQTDDPARQLDLAMQFAAGRGVAKNEATARECLAAAAAGGSERAQLELGLFLLQGKGGPVDMPGARYWLERAASSGSQAAARVRAELEQSAAARQQTVSPQPVPADRCGGGEDADRQLELAMKHASGDGVPKDEAVARACLFKAAEAGSQRAQLELGLYLLQGRGGPADPSGARFWLGRAANSGSEAAARLRDELERSASGSQASSSKQAPATNRCDADTAERQLALAMKLAAGDGVERNDADARTCLTKAAEAGSPRAQLELAVFMLNGRGGPTDVPGAVDWLGRAAAAGSDAAYKMREELVGQNAITVLRRGSKDIPREAEPSQVHMYVVGAFLLALWGWLSLGNGSPWPWKWGRRNWS
jgi:TPR repeat protein